MHSFRASAAKKATNKRLKNAPGLGDQTISKFFAGRDGQQPALDGQVSKLSAGRDGQQTGRDGQSSGTGASDNLAGVSRVSGEAVAESDDDDYGSVEPEMARFAEYDAAVGTVASASFSDDDDDYGMTAQEAAEFARFELAALDDTVASGSRKRKATSSPTSDDEYGPAPAEMAQLAELDDVDDEPFLSLRDSARLPHIIARLKSQVPKPDDGSDVELDLLSVLKHMFSYVIYWAVHVSGWSTEMMEELVDCGAHGLADYVQTHMDEDMWTYLDGCIREGKPFDLREIMAVLDSKGSVRNSGHAHGVYFIMLVVKDVVYPYCGSSNQSGGIRNRILQHMLKSERARHTSKVLYQIWDAKSGTIPDEDVHFGGVILFPSSDSRRFGRARLLAYETIMTILVCNFNSSDSLQGFDPNAALPKSLVDMFCLTAASRGCKTVDESLPSARRMLRAMVFTSGNDIVPTNIQLPLSEPSLQHTPLMFRLRDGVVLDVQFLDDGHWKARLHRSGYIYFSSEDIDDMKARGFDTGYPSSRSLDVKLVLSDQDESDNWAAVEHDGITPGNPEGYELARRILLVATWVAQDGSEETINLKMETRQPKAARRRQLPSGLQRACLSMTLYEYAYGLLPNGEPNNGRRRMDYEQTGYASVAKAWQRGEVECDTAGDHNKVDSGKAKTKRVANKTTLARFRCPNTNCKVEQGVLKGLRFECKNATDLVSHLFRKPGEIATRCGKKLRLTNVNVIDEDFVKGCAMPGVDLTDFTYIPGARARVSAKPSKYRCLGCQNGFAQWNGIRQHMSNMNAQKCFDAYGFTRGTDRSKAQLKDAIARSKLV
jgi:hypothetical protein